MYIRHGRELLLSREADLATDVGEPPFYILTNATTHEFCRYCERVGTGIRARESEYGGWLAEDSTLA